MPQEDGEELKKAAFGVLSLLKDNLGAHSILSIEDEDEVVIAALKRHGLHLSTHAIDQTHLDPFKLICWLGVEIVSRLEEGDGFEHQAGTILDAVIKSLEEVLALETSLSVRVPQDDKMLIKRFLMEEIKGNPDHGIGFNGLFVAFHCLRSTFKQMNGA
jgi:hypothetical protein